MRLSWKGPERTDASGKRIRRKLAGAHTRTQAVTLLEAIRTHLIDSCENFRTIARTNTNKVQVPQSDVEC